MSFIFVLLVMLVSWIGIKICEGWVIPFAAMPGTLVATFGNPTSISSKRRNIAGFICSICQSYIYLSFAFLHGVLIRVVHAGEILKASLWVLSFLIIISSIFWSVGKTTTAYKEGVYKTGADVLPQIFGLQWSLYWCLTGFFLLAFFPNTLGAPWMWIKNIVL